MTNLGHEIALSEIRISSRSFALRVMWSLGGAFCFLVLCVFGFSSHGILKHLIDFCMAITKYHIRQLPMFGVRQSDISNVIHTHKILMGDATFWKISFSLSIVVFLVIFFWLSYSFYKKGQRSQLERIMRGNHLVSPKEHNTIMQHEYLNHTRGIKFKRFKTTLKVNGESLLLLGKQKVIVPESLQYLHFAFIGASGCGKSTAIEEIISHIKNRREKALIVDLNGAFYSKFGEKRDHILSLRDPRAKKWDFWCEPVEPENIAAAMIEADAGSQQYFWKGARAVLTSLLRNNSNCHELWDDFQKSTADIRKKLSDKNEIAQRIIGSGDGDQADGILGTTVLDFAFLKELNQWSQGQNNFSIIDWVKNDADSGCVYLIVSDKDIEISKPLLRVWFDLACIGALNRDAATHNSHLWLIIDELKSIGQLPSLPAILDKGRKYKTSAVLGFQAISQIEKIYGHQDCKSILQGIQNQFYFKMTEVESAKYASDVLGEQEFEQANLGITFGQKNNSDRGSLNKSTTHKKVVLPDEIKSLRPLECYAKICHHQPFKLHFDVSTRQIIHAPVKSCINKNYQIGKTCVDGTFIKQKETDQSPQWLLGVPQNHHEARI